MQANLACKGRSCITCFPAASTTTPTTTTTRENVQLSIKLRVVVSQRVHKECVPRINTKPRLLVARMPPADAVLWRRRSIIKCVRKDNTREGEREDMSAPVLPSYLPTYLPTCPQDVPTYLRTFLPEGPGSLDGGWTESDFFIQVSVHYLTNHGRNLSYCFYYLSTYHPPLPTCSTSRKAN